MATEIVLLGTGTPEHSGDRASAALLIRSNGCVMQPPPLAASGTATAEVWQYAQSPRRRETTAACAKTYAADGNCYVRDPALKGIFLDLNVASSADPSHGR